MSTKYFIDHFVEYALRNQSLAKLYDEDINKQCFDIQKDPVDITPRIIKTQPFQLRRLKALHIYPAKADSEEYREKTGQILESISCAGQCVFEISGNNTKIECRFYADDSELSIIETSLNNFFPNSVTEPGADDSNYYPQKLFLYDFLPTRPFFKSLSSYYVISPLNIIPRLLLKLEKGQVGVYQVIFRSLPGEFMHRVVQEAIDCEWRNLQGPDIKVPPSLHVNSINEKIDNKASEFKTFFAVNVRIILPTDAYSDIIRTFSANYNYGSAPFAILDNGFYSQEQIKKMLNNKEVFHTGWLLNSNELSSLLHCPFEIIGEKDFDSIFPITPAGDKPNKTLDYKDITIGRWFQNSKEIHFPIQHEIAIAWIMGLPRSGKSCMLTHICMEKFKRREACISLDHHGDMIEAIKQLIPKDRIDDVIVIDFGLDVTPQITIRGNVDLNNPSKVADDMSESMRDATAGREKFFGPRMSFYLAALWWIYAVTDLSLPEIQLLISKSKKGKILRNKIKQQIRHPIVRDFLEEISSTPPESLLPTLTKLSTLLLDEKSFRFFTLDENKIKLKEAMDTGKLILVNLASGIIGKQRASILSAVIDGLVTNIALSRASIPYKDRKPVTFIKDEFYLGAGGGGDLDFQFVTLPKYNISVVVAHQYMSQVEGNTREVLATAGSRIMFKTKPEDAEKIARDFGLEPTDLTELRKFQAFVKIEDEVIKIDTPKPIISQTDYSKEIMKNCIKKYYLKHEEKEPEELLFDVL